LSELKQIGIIYFALEFLIIFLVIFIETKVKAKKISPKSLKSDAEKPVKLQSKKKLVSTKVEANKNKLKPTQEKDVKPNTATSKEIKKTINTKVSEKETKAKVTTRKLTPKLNSVEGPTWEKPKAVQKTKSINEGKVLDAKSSIKKSTTSTASKKIPKK